MTNEGEIRRFEKLSLRIDTDKTADAVATSEEAIYVLNLLKRQDLKINSAATEAIDMAISALEKQEQERWIQVTERLPEEYGEYRITWKTSSDPGKRFIGDAEYEPGFEWDDAHDRFFGEWLLEDYVKAYPDVEVTAWKPIGEPYTEEEDDKS